MTKIPLLLVFSIVFLLLTLFADSVQAQEIFYYHTNHLGSPVAITNENGDVIWRADYKPFGGVLNEQGNGDFKYNTKELDADTGFYYYGARYYKADVGRFISADTVKGSLLNPQSFNLYIYTLNNPLRFVDPRGEQLLSPPIVSQYPVTDPIEELKWQQMLGDVLRDDTLKVSMVYAVGSDIGLSTADIIEKEIREAVKGSGVTLEINSVFTKEGFAKALEESDVVLVHGHSRYGRGPAFGTYTNYFRMGKEEITIPLSEAQKYGDIILSRVGGGMVKVKAGHSDLNRINLNARCLIMGDCSSIPHFKEVVRKKSPNTVFIGTTEPGGSELEAISPWFIQCMVQRQPKWTVLRRANLATSGSLSSVLGADYKWR